MRRPNIRRNVLILREIVAHIAVDESGFLLGLRVIGQLEGDAARDSLLGGYEIAR